MRFDIDAIRREYERDGVVRVRAVLSADEVAEVRDVLAGFESRLESVPVDDYTLEPDGQSVRNFWRLDRNEPYFARLRERPDFLDLVRPLLGGDPVPLGVETFNKPAKVGSAVPFHQDNAYFCQTPPDVLTLWIALDAVTPENGPVEYLRGSHRELWPHAPSGVKGNSYGLARQPEPGAFESLVVTLDPGDAVIHHGQTIHRSDVNRSGRSRLALIIPYRGAHTRTDEALLAKYDEARKLTPQGG